jgi:Mn-dependent DtxR family transcriptional regulator
MDDDVKQVLELLENSHQPLDLFQIASALHIKPYHVERALATLRQRSVVAVVPEKYYIPH